MPYRLRFINGAIYGAIVSTIPAMYNLAIWPLVFLVGFVFGWLFPIFAPDEYYASSGDEE